MAVQLAGSINVDLIQNVEALPRPGETVLARDSVRLPGGKGANQAVAAARVGARVRMCGAVGADDGGAWMRALLDADGIDTALVATLPDCATGTAFITVDAHGENQIIVVPGANARLKPEQVAAPDADTRVLLAQLEIPVDTVAALFSAPGAERCTRILNGAPAVRAAASLFGLCDVLIVNQTELALYLDLDHAPEDAHAALAARRLLTRADQVVVVTLGAGGAVAVRPDRHFHAPAFPVTPVDTIGAGDCFVGALAAMLDANGTVEDALPFANAAAALCTQRRGAIPAMPTRADVDGLYPGTGVA